MKLDKKAIDKIYSLFGRSKKEKSLTDRINNMRAQLGTGLGNKPVSFVDKIRQLTKERDALRQASFFSDKEEDSYSLGGSPGMSSVGAIGGNTNRGLVSLPSDYHKIRLEKIKSNLKSNNTSSTDEYHCHVNDYYGDGKRLSKYVSHNWFTERSPGSKAFPITAPKGLAEKVRKYKESLKK